MSDSIQKVTEAEGSWSVRDRIDLTGAVGIVRWVLDDKTPWWESITWWKSILAKLE